MEDKTRVIISLSEGKIDVSGSEKFVREQLDRFKDLIDKKLSAVPVHAPQFSPPIQPPQISNPAVNQPPVVTGENPYPNVIAIQDDKINILRLKGSNKAEKSNNIALLYLLAKKQKGEDSATFKEIRDVCKDHACLDATNFSAKLKSDKENFIFSGARMSQSAKLTKPGLTKAKGLASELNAQ